MQTIAHLENRVGGTPLVGCPRLAAHVGLPGLRLKMEGGNPTGTQKDRIAHLEIKDATHRGVSEVTAASCGNYGVAVAHAAHLAGLACTIFVPESFAGERVTLMERLGADVIRVPGTYEDAVAMSRAHARHGAHDANPGGPNTLRTLAGYAHIAEELHEQAPVAPAAVGVPIGNGTTLAGIHFGFRALWSKGAADFVPVICGGTSKDNNPVPPAVAARTRRAEPIDPDSVRENPVNEPLVNWDALDGTACLTAVLDSQGGAWGFSDQDLLELHDVLLQDGYDAHPASMAAVAALRRAAEEGLFPREAAVVAVLTSGRSTIQVEPLPEPEPELETLIHELDTFLARYSDPENEIREAVQRAFADGHVLVAREGGERIGYAVLTPMPFRRFFPAYHLSYIAVSARARGRGVGTLLMEAAIRATNGDLSLHVETSNPRAIRLYEKFGFHAKYYRMLYKGPKPGQVDPAEGSGWQERGNGTNGNGAHAPEPATPQPMA